MTRRRFLSSVAAGATLGPFLGSLKASDAPIHVDVAPREPECVKVDFEALLCAIAERETGNDDMKVGPAGERSKYQITETVWKQQWSPLATPFSYRNHASVCKGKAAHATAKLHLLWLDAHIPHVTMSERYERWFALSFAWKAGLESWLRYAHGGKAMSARDLFYAASVSNLYVDRLKTLSPHPAPCSPSPSFTLSPISAH